LSGKASNWLDKLAAKAQLALAWERIWPSVAALLVCVAAFVSCSWLGLWLVLPASLRIAGVAIFALAAIAALLPLVRTHWPSRREALARIDRDSGLPHRPASALEDELANASDDPGTRALWSLHRSRIRQLARMFTVSAPAPRLAARDPWAIRSAAIVGVVASAFVAGVEKGPRIAAAFDWRSAPAATRGFRFDAWIDPPLYTGKAPILLNAKVAAAEAKGEVHVDAPAGSTLIVRSSGDAELTVQTSGGLTAAGTQTNEKAGDKSESERKFTLSADAHVTIALGDKAAAAFNITAIPDKPPTITLTDKPKANLHGSLTLAYKIDDDYGVSSAEATFSKPGTAAPTRSLADPPKAPLTLPGTPGGLGEAQTTVDLSEHPWAGARVLMTLTAHDEGGNEGKSEPTEVKLPQRPFTKPLAKALVEQRRNLVLNPDDHPRVGKALSALLIAPEQFGVAAGVYLGLSVALQRLDHAKTDDALREVAGLLWEIALQIEDGDTSEAERDLRAAERQLREALQRGASEEEIKKLTEELQAALDRYLSELADKMAREDQDSANQTPDRQSNRSITQRDLKSMLDRLQEMAKSGSMADAQRMLDQLQSILENLRTAKRGRSDPNARDLDQALDELDAMTRNEQELRDDTFRRDQQGRQGPGKRRQPKQNSQKGQQGEPGQDAQTDEDQGDDQSAENDTGDGQPPNADALRKRQQDLRQRLENMKRQMKQLGMSPEKGLDDAEQAMNDAEGSLSQEGGEGKAVEAEGRAIDGLRRGAQGLSDQMQSQGEAMGQGEGEGQPGSGQQSQRGRGYRDDPLGRRSDPNGNGINGQELDGREAGATPAQRARKVLEELRRRLGERERPSEELDYLERLIRRY
jgi:uncharacterized protein (TIGR02302 family)